MFFLQMSKNGNCGFLAKHTFAAIFDVLVEFGAFFFMSFDTFSKSHFAIFARSSRFPTFGLFSVNFGAFLLMLEMSLEWDFRTTE